MKIGLSNVLVLRDVFKTFVNDARTRKWRVKLKRWGYATEMVTGHLEILSDGEPPFVPLLAIQVLSKELIISSLIDIDDKFSFPITDENRIFAQLAGIYRRALLHERRKQ